SPSPDNRAPTVVSPTIVATEMQGAGAEKPTVFKQRNITPTLFFSLYGDGDVFTMQKLADKIENDILNSGKVSQISIFNKPIPEITIEVKEKELLRYGITLQEIATAISANNRDISAGQLKSQEEEMLIRLRSRSSSPDKISDIVLKALPDGKIIKIRDIAEVHLKTSEDYYPQYMNGKICITGLVQKLPEEDLQDITDFLRNYVAEYNKTNKGTQLKITFEFMDLLNSRLDMLIKNGIQGLILVILCLGIFLNFRIALWVAWGIPSAFLAMFIIANLYGITINMISLFGMILVVGILVDDGIVIAENIYTHFERGKSPARAAIDGTVEVLSPVISSVLTTIVAFSPLLIATGHMEFMFEMAFVVILSLLLSLLEAFFILPAHLGSTHVLKNRDPNQRPKLRQKFDQFFEGVKNKYERLMIFVLKWRYVAIFTPVFFILLTVGLFRGGFIQATFFPNVDFDNFVIDVAYTPGSGEKQTYAFLKQCEQAVWEVNDELKKELNDTINIINNTFVSVGNSFNGVELGAHAGKVEVYPRNLEGLPITNNQISQRVKEKIKPPVNIQKFAVQGANRWGRPVSISVRGESNEDLDTVCKILLHELNQYSELKNISETTPLGKQEILLKLKPQAYILGLNETFIANQVRQGFYGELTQRLQEGRNEIKIWVRYPQSERENIGQLEKIKIKTPAGEYFLTELADLEIKRSPVTIIHYNGEKEIRIEADMVNPNNSVPEVLARIESEVLNSLKIKFPNLDFEFLGQQQRGKESTEQIKSLYSYAFLIILLILMLQFKSIGTPFIVLMMIPLGILGAIWGHGIHDKSVSLLSAWGIVALSGVVINDAIVFISKFNSALLEGLKLRDAIIDAGKSRIRPILLTSMTTCAGLFPLIFEDSFQAQFLVPMAISLAYGILFGTIFILVLFPVIIHVKNDIVTGVTNFWKGEKVQPEEVEVAIKHSKISID
ncbi:MAG: efflux RND transporter permease subunit, partial [Bacteroidales bacterium]